jgi:beta-galactosidase/beta-glucuronidase
MSIPRPEHPKPQFERGDWINLNGTWTFCFDFGKSGLERGLVGSRGFQESINVPFCPESRLSGVEHKDFIEMLWYHRKLEIPAAWKGRRVLLHFGGVDWECEAFIDGRPAGTHWGGTASFCFDVTPLVKPGAAHDLVLLVRDDTRSGRQPGGKQSPEYGFKRKRCHYTRTTGIWSTVWMEAVHPHGLREVHIVPDFDAGRFSFIPRFRGLEEGLQFKATVLDGGKTLAEKTRRAGDGLSLEIALPSPKAWSPESPFLYDLEFRVLDGSGRVLDLVKSYAGLRKVHIEGNRILLNNKPLYQRLVLDQGFYPDGIWTAPSDADLKKDIELSMAAGFNGARLHQKVFEERFHYWADRLGYLTWGETASWACTPPTSSPPGTS